LWQCIKYNGCAGGIECGSVNKNNDSDVQEYVHLHVHACTH